MVKKLKANSLQLTANTYDVIIVGGGPAGLMSACIAGKNGSRVLVLEKNEELGKKLLISGGGRCNLTNANPDHREFVSKYGKKGNFLFTPFSVFGVEETIKFFNDLGVKTKTEPGFRVFPESDRSEDILNALINEAKKVGVEFKLGAEVLSLSSSRKRGSNSSVTASKRLSASGGKQSRELKLDSRFYGNDTIKSVELKSGEKIEAKKFILATGGKSHPETGSTGDGFKWLKEIGHKVIESNPALVPIKIKEHWIGDFSGITLENVGISVFSSLQGGTLKKRGKVLFTHEGLSGPTILNMSKDVGELLQYPPQDGRAGGEVKIAIDFFPGIGLDMIHEKFKKLFEEHSNKKIKNLVLDEVPSKIFNKILDLLKIDGEIEMHSIFREERISLIEKLKKFELRVEGLLGYDKAIISSGGLDLDEVDFKTMGSKLYENLFFVGDILDFDRPSGGFSLQLCWTTGYIAGKESTK